MPVTNSRFRAGRHHAFPARAGPDQPRNRSTKSRANWPPEEGAAAEDPCLTPKGGATEVLRNACGVLSSPVPGTLSSSSTCTGTCHKEVQKALRRQSRYHWKPPRAVRLRAANFCGLSDPANLRLDSRRGGVEPFRSRTRYQMW